MAKKTQGLASTQAARQSAEALRKADEINQSKQQLFNEAKFLGMSPKKLAAVRAQLVEKRLPVIDAMFQSVKTEMRSRFGSTSAASMNNPFLAICIPVPSLALEWFFGNDGLPLSRQINIVGLEACYKSALFYEMMRWFADVEGYGMLGDTEKKYAEDFCRSIVGPRSYDPMIVFRSEHMGSWMERSWDALTQIMEKMDGTEQNPGIGRIVPMLVGIDSLVGQLSSETAEKVRKDGAVGRAHPVEAMELMRYLSEIANVIGEWPISFVTVNHNKPKKDQRGRNKDHQPGGHAPRFHRSIDIRVTRSENHNQDTASRAARVIYMKTLKNSCGAEGRMMPARITYWNEGEGESQHQVTVWDWNWSLIHILADKRLPAETRDKIRAITGLRIKTLGGDGKCYSAKFGVEKEHPISFSEMGRRIQAKPKMCESLRDLFGIKRRPRFNQSVDYRMQIVKHQEELEAQSGPKKKKVKKKVKPSAGDQ